MNKLDGQSMDLVKENVEKLKELFPSIVKEDKIDFDELELLLGENINRNNEQYSFTWNGKTEATKLAQKRSTGTLRPCKEESKDWDNTQNLYIEGDNLEVLRLLQASYNGRIKMVYIDPPYNTGHDFVYKDNFEDNIKNYKEQTGQAAKSNADTDGRYHTNWLNMMYPRLKLARNLLTDDGVIFISIDDNEQANLKKICDEVFGENNCDVMVWRKSGVGRDGKMKNTTTFRKDHEYIIVCFKKVPMLNKSFEKPSWANEYSNPDNDPRGPYKAGSISNKEEASNPNSMKYYSVISPTGKVFTRQFNVTKEEFEKLDKDNRIYWGKNGDNVPSVKIFVNEKREVTTSSYLNENYELNSSSIDFKLSTTTQGSKELENLLKVEGLGNEMRPKPVDLIYKLSQIGSNKEDIILDFFSGSATTAHAVMQLNAEDGGNRKFIMVQLPEKTEEDSEAYKAEYKNICEIGKERIRRSGEKVQEEFLEKFVAGVSSKTKLFEDDKDIKSMIIKKEFAKTEPIFDSIDIGFKVFKLDSSNLKKWDNTPTKDIDTIKDRIQASMDYLKDDRNELDLVYEVMLKYGIDLSYPVRKTENEKAYIVEAPEYKLLVCTMPNISLGDVESFANENVGTYLFADRCFGSDSLLINTEEILKSRNKEMRLF